MNISRVLDHTIQGIGQVTHVYARYDFLEEKREALDLWGRYLATLLQRQLRASGWGSDTTAAAMAPFRGARR